MLRIRSQQVQTFEQAALAAFELRMVDHLRTYFPWHYRIWGPETTRRVVQYGCKKAQTYGFTTERNICLYLALDHQPGIFLLRNTHSLTGFFGYLSLR